LAWLIHCIRTQQSTIAIDFPNATMLSKFGLLITLMLAISASARPAEKRWGGFGGPGGLSLWQPSKASSYLDFAKRAGENWGSCDLNNALPAMNLGNGKSIKHSRSRHYH
jgi:hypothetical protein